MGDWSVSNLLQGHNLALLALFGLLIAAYFGLALSFHGAVQIS